MAAEGARQTIQLTERSSTYSREEEALSKWVIYSFLVHGVFIAGLFIAPFLPSRSAPSYPIYTVDLVGGEKIGGPKLGADLTPVSPTQQKAEKAQPETSEPIRETKKEPKREKIKPVEKVPPPPEKTASKKEVLKKEPAKKESVKETKNESREIKTDAQPTKSETKSERGLSEETRERLIQAALDRVKDRATKPGTTNNEAISTGPGEGDGAAAIGPGGRGGGIVKGPEFILYYNKMLSTIRQNWTWPGQRADLKTTVHFGIRENGEIVGLKIVQPSGDSSYDDSVVRALRKSSPLASPPEPYRRDFADVKLTFRPEDLGGSGR
jgi:colicin import membrane protein